MCIGKLLIRHRHFALEDRSVFQSGVVLECAAGRRDFPLSCNRILEIIVAAKAENGTVRRNNKVARNGNEN